MQYLNQSNETSHASAPYSDIFKIHEIRFRGYFVIANYRILNQFKGYNS